MKEKPLRHRSPLLWIALPMTGGLVAGRMGYSPPVSVSLGCAILCVAAAVTAAWGAERRWAPAFACALAFAGLASYRIHRNRIQIWETFPAREIQMLVRCQRIFPSRDPERLAALASVVHADRHVSELAGQAVYITLGCDRRAPRPIRGSRLRVRGVLDKVPAAAKPYSFEGYLSDVGVNFRVSRGDVLGEEGVPGRYRRFCARAESRFHAILGLGIERRRPDLAAVLRAMMLGQTGEMSASQNLLFLQSGTLHLFAISGLHIVAIALAIHGILASLRIPHVLRFFLGSLALWLYVDITGAAPSAVRALLMVGFVELALLIRRGINPLATLTTAWVIVLAVAPLQFFTASFQMSYGIVAALLLVGVPLFEAWKSAWRPFEGIPEAGRSSPRRFAAWLGGHLLSSAALGASASLVGLVAGIAFFRLFTPGSMLINVVMIPVSTLVIYSGFASLLLGLLGLETFAAVFNHSGALVLLAMEEGIRQALRLPGMFFPGQFRWEGLGGASLAALLVLSLACYAWPGRNRPLRWVPPFALCALLLAFAVRYG